MNKLISSLVFVLLTTRLVCGQVKYTYRFNPQQGIVNETEQPYRKETCLNGLWQIMPVYAKDTTDGLPSSFTWDPTPIRIPSPWNINGFTHTAGSDFVTFPSYPKQWEEAPVAIMKKEFSLPAGWNGQRYFLHFDAVAGKAIYYLNGKKIGENFDIFFPYELDVTKYVKARGSNELIVKVIASRLFDKQGKYGRRPYVSGSFWGTYISGIWQDVYLLAKPVVYISDVYVDPQVLSHELKIDVTVTNPGPGVQKVSLGAVVRKWINLAGNSVNDAAVEKSRLDTQVTVQMDDQKVIPIAPGTSYTISLTKKVDNRLAEWTPDNPNLYGLVLHLKSNGKVTDIKYQRFGWRQFSFEGDTMLLNGKPFHLRGDSWHFMGVPEMTRRYAWAWYSTLKKANGNAVRLHAQPYPHFFLDVADEMGICVLDESGNWASDGGPDVSSERLWDNSELQVKHLVLRDRNHPSVFGWSVCNEMEPVVRNVFHAPDSIARRLVHEIDTWVKIARQLDPSRPWISGDGETNYPTDLPTTVGHYGDISSMKRWASEGKPWGIGEQGMAYYGTPLQVSKYNGNRAFISQQGRMEGLADEAYQLISQQRKLGASYVSVFNMVWYGLKPLALGMPDTSRPSTLADGVYLTRFKEGEPGMQPERIGPYTTTLNPGYDPSLPVFEPWPLFDAIKAANAIPPQPFEIASTDTVATSVRGFQPQKRTVIFLSPRASTLYQRLSNLGVEMGGAALSAQHPLILLDGAMLPEGKDTLALLKKYGMSGASIFVMDVDKKQLHQVNRILPLPLQLTERRAASFIKLKNDPVVSGLNNIDLYFNELIKGAVMHYGLDGDLVNKGNTIISACNTDWSEWNNQPEYNKTGRVLKSERERKPAGAALVRYERGNTDYYACTIDMNLLKASADKLLYNMLSNLGAGFSKTQDDMAMLSSDGYLKSALVSAKFSADDTSVLQAVQQDFLSGELHVNPSAGAYAGGHAWKIEKATARNSTFDLRRIDPSGPASGAVSYLSFWIYSPRSLVNLLVEPDMPAMDMQLSTNARARVILNGQVLVPLTPEHTDSVEISNLPLEKGWNHFLIKSIQVDRDWDLGIKFNSNKADFMKDIKASAVN